MATAESLYRQAKFSDACPNCGPKAIITEDYAAGDRICTECGLVVGDRVLDVGSEWRSFSDDNKRVDPNRVGAAQNPLFSDGDLSTRVSGLPGGGGFHSKEEFGGDSLQRANIRNAMSSMDRSLQTAYKEITLMASRINLGDSIQMRAKKLYKVVKESNHLSGHSHQAISAACLYIACRQEGVARTFKEIFAVSNAKSKTKVGRCYKKIVDNFDIRLEQISENMYMSRFCDKLDLKRSVTSLCNEAARRAQEIGVVDGKVPISVAAATIFLTSQVIGSPKAVKDVSAVSGVAEGTIRNSYREMYPVRHYLFSGHGGIKAAMVHNILDWGAPQKPGGLEKAEQWAKAKGVIPLQAPPPGEFVKKEEPL